MLSSHWAVSIFNGGILFGTNRSFRRGTLHSDCFSSQLFNELFAKVSLSFFFLFIGVNTADEIALELIHDEVESPMFNCEYCQL